MRLPAGDTSVGSTAALSLSDVSVWEWDAQTGRRVGLLHDIRWSARAGEHWAVIGPNGAGKSTLLDVAAGSRFPSRGAVTLLGERLGHADVREIRARIGHVDARTETMFAPRRTAFEVVLTGATGSIAVLEDRLTDDDRERAAALLAAFGCSHTAARAFGRCSQGERRRILLARALMRRPPLLLLDEPADGLDLPGREALLASLESLQSSDPLTALVVVTHHLEELPSSISHALLLRDGRIVAAGSAQDVLTGPALSACFATPVRVSHYDGRWSARARPTW